MSGWVKVVVWILVLLVCAGAGAFVASRTDPFPPGVEDPGARPRTTDLSVVERSDGDRGSYVSFTR